MNVTKVPKDCFDKKKRGNNFHNMSEQLIVLTCTA